jgi:acetyl-CoA synthetase
LILKPEVIPSRELALGIFKLIRQTVAPYRRPRIIQFVGNLPKTRVERLRELTSGDRNHS